MIKLLYTNPQVTVITNGLNSKLFDIERGTRQGCPLSPLLFALVIEPLAESIRQCQHLFGITVGDEEHRISLFADDTLLYISEPERSIPATLKCLSDYSSLSGYKINLSKSIALSFHIPNLNDLSSLSPFRITSVGFKYLDIFITPILKDLFKKITMPLFLKLLKKTLTFGGHFLFLFWVGLM